MMVFVTFAVVFVVLSIVFAVLEALWPATPAQPRRRRGFLTDVVYWFVAPISGQIAAVIAGLAAAATFVLLFGVSFDGDSLRAFIDRDTFVKTQPLWLQLIEGIIVGDTVSYWMHRLFHENSRLWRVHAVHHSSVDLDWLSAARVHPANEVAMQAVQVAVLVAIGFDPAAFGAVPFLTFYAVYLHANLSWDYGPLRYVLASPAFHRWHHTSEQEGLNKNFAGMLPAIDLLFGTFTMPRDRRATQFGVVDPVPSGFVGQMLYPLRRSSS